MEQEPNNEIDQLRGNDLSPVMMAREKAPKETWFFERLGDGKVFACEEKEAWETMYNNSTWKRRDFKLLGASDGTTYVRVANESKLEAAKLQTEIEALTREMQGYQRTEHRLMMDEVVDMEDLTDPVNAANVEKIKRLRKIMNRLETQLSAKEKAFKEISKTIITKAFEAELAAARGHIKMPRRMDVITPKASPQERRKILTLMEGRQ